MFIVDNKVLVLTPQESTGLTSRKQLKALKKQHKVKQIIVEQLNMSASIAQGAIVMDRKVLL